jgi:hypothetical protein
MGQAVFKNVRAMHPVATQDVPDSDGNQRNDLTIDRRAAPEPKTTDD